MRDVTIGIDIGGTNTTFGIVDKDGKCINKGEIPTTTHTDVNLYIQDLADAINECIKNTEGDVELRGIGVGAPNGNYYNGTIEFAPNLKWEGVVPIVELLKKHFDVPAIALTNDANAAAIGEMVYGGAKNMKNFIMITLGTGVGSGIVVNGDLVYGHDGFAGEMGHTVVVKDGRECGCGRRGCLETYTSASGIARTAFELMVDTHTTSELRDVPFNELTSKKVYEAAVNGDKIALETFEKTGQLLGMEMADAVSYFSPEAFFLFGGPTAAGEYIFEPIRRNLEERLLVIFKNKIKVLPSKLPMGDAAILGASALAWKELGKVYNTNY